MATSAAEAWDRGYQQAIKVIFDLAMAYGDKAEKIRLTRERDALEHAGDYQGVRAQLDAAHDDLLMSRPTAQFYLCMSPGSFKTALARGPHPFEEPNGGATKGAVDRWFKELVAAKHADEIPKVHPLRVSRDLRSGRPFLVDVSGAILADGAISNIGAADLAAALGQGAGIRILTLDSALAQPWRNKVEREQWAAWRHLVLTEAINDAKARLRDAEAQDLASIFPDKPEGPGIRTL